MKGLEAWQTLGIEKSHLGIGIWSHRLKSFESFTMNCTKEKQKHLVKYVSHFISNTFSKFEGLWTDSTQILFLSVAMVLSTAIVAAETFCCDFPAFIPSVSIICGGSNQKYLMRRSFCPSISIFTKHLLNILYCLEKETTLTIPRSQQSHHFIMLCQFICAFFQLK